jgi:transglutaminase-like putative cysteine protease
MRISVQADLTYRFAESCEVLLLLEAARGPDQTVESERLVLTPVGEITRRDDALTGERRTVLTAQGDVNISYQATVEIAARGACLLGAQAMSIRDLPAEVLPFLRGSRYCPSDEFEAFVRRKFDGLHGGDKVEAMVDWIRSHLDYRAGVSTSRSTARDTFLDCAGVCRDFTHLAISLCRAADIPARAVSAYAWGLEPPDMHAVMEVYLEGRWRLIDPTGKAPVDGLVRVATGRDAADIAFMTIFGRADLVAQSFSALAADAPVQVAAE